jgi:hypothetical protein
MTLHEWSHVAAVAVAIAGLAWLPLRKRLTRRVADRLLATLALLAAAAWMNLGTFQGRGVFTQPWEQFHAVLGSRYFEELGYDGLYVASLQAQVETSNAKLPATVRDLRDNALVPSATLQAHAAEVRARFSDARWQAFLYDHAIVMRSALGIGGIDFANDIRRDHGFHPSPAWIAIARLTLGSRPISQPFMTLLGVEDLALLAVALLVVARTFGARVAWLALLLFGTGQLWHFGWVGGSVLRFDWLAALLLAACAAHRGRWGWAGAAIGWAAMDRIFPAAFLLGPLVACALDAWRERRLTMRSPLVRLGIGFALACAAGAVVGCFAGRGPEGWLEFAGVIRRHERTWLNNNVGLKSCVAYGWDVLVSGQTPIPWDDAMSAAMSRRALVLRAAQVALLVVAVRAAWSRRGARTLLPGALAVHALVAPTCYYWCLLAIAAFDGGVAVAGVLVVAIAGWSGELAGLAPATIYGVASWLVGAALVVALARSTSRSQASTSGTSEGLQNPPSTSAVQQASTLPGTAGSPPSS